jgi:hypothetical protein
MSKVHKLYLVKCRWDKEKWKRIYRKKIKLILKVEVLFKKDNKLMVELVDRLEN